jgi:hypothetical protein
VDWKNTHPLLRFVDFSDVRVAGATSPKVPGWAVSLVEAPQGTLLLAGELGRQRIVWVGFDLLESNWPLKVSFPIFIVNAAEWLNPANAQGGQLLVKVGEAFRLPLPRPADGAQVVFPDGARKTIPLERDATEVVFGDTARQGVYHLVLGTNDIPFCVNLLDAAESNIRPRDELELGKYTRVEAATTQKASRELWRTVAVLGLAMLMFEWWYYHRRTV